MKTGAIILVGVGIVAAIGTAGFFILKPKETFGSTSGSGDSGGEGPDMGSSGGGGSTSGGGATIPEGTKHQVKKSIKQYLKDSYGQGWRSKWRDLKDACKSYTKNVKGKPKGQWRKYLSEYLASINFGAGEVDLSTTEDSELDDFCCPFVADMSEYAQKQNQIFN